MNRKLGHVELKLKKTFPFNHRMSLPKLCWLLGGCITCPASSDDSWSRIAWAGGLLLSLFFSAGSKGGRQDRAWVWQRAAKMTPPLAQLLIPCSMSSLSRQIFTQGHCSAFPMEITEQPTAKGKSACWKLLSTRARGAAKLSFLRKGVELENETSQGLGPARPSRAPTPPLALGTHFPTDALKSSLLTLALRLF